MTPIFSVGISLECSLAVSDRSFVMTRICVIGRLAYNISRRIYASLVGKELIGGYLLDSYFSSSSLIPVVMYYYSM